MTATVRLSEPMRLTLRRLPDSWVNFTSGFVSCFPSVEALEKRGLAAVRMTKRRVKGGRMETIIQVRRTDAGLELVKG